MVMDDEFISDEEVEAYEKKSDPARRSVRWTFAAVAAAFALIGGAYVLGFLEAGQRGFLGADLRGGETFPLWSAEREEGASFAKSSDEGGAVASGVCGFESGPSSSPSLHSGQAISPMFSEIAWMGTEEGAQYEWIELANVSGTNAEVGGWSVVDKDEQIQFVFPKSAVISAGGFYLLARSADKVGNAKADVRYTGNLKNEDEGLRLFNGKCEVMDEVLAAPKWPAGESVERRTMERSLTTLRQGSGQVPAWYTSLKVGGTPRTYNSSPPPPEPAPVVPTAATSTPTFQSGLATSSPTSIGAAAVVVSEVMAGKDGAANWDFVELHNSGTSAVNLTGWSVKKKSSTGSESTLVSISRLNGVTIPAGGYLLLAHPDYAGTTDVVWPKSYTLAYTNNAVVLYDADGVKVDEIAWTEISKGQSYAEVSGVWVITNPTPKAAP